MTLGPVLSCFASTAPGVELLTAAELQALGIAPGASEPGGVAFNATPPQLGEALLWLRTANRVTVRFAAFRATSFAELERKAGLLAWSDILAPGGAVHFRVTSKKSRLYHQDGIAERLERCAQQAVSGLTAVRGPAEAEQLEAVVTRTPPVQRFVVRVLRDQFTLSADAAGALLYSRGWRQAVAKAPLRETLAAALLLSSGWQPGDPLVDPFCGSGTILIEAAQMSRRMAPGRARRFAAELWPALPRDLMAAARTAAESGEITTQFHVAGQDRDAGAVAAAESNAVRAGVADTIDLVQAPLSALSADPGAGWLVTNPPYGARIGDRHDLRDLYAVLGRVMRERRPGWRLAMLSAESMLAAQTGLALEEVLRTTNGGIPVQVVRS